MKSTRSKMIYTERLCLRAITESDLRDGMALLANDEVAKTFMLPEFKTEEEVDALFRRIMKMSNAQECFVYGIYLDNTMIGFVNDVDKTENEIELGYVIHPAKKNNGFATEVLKALINELFDMGYSAVKAGAFEQNAASMRVMEKCGMTRTFHDEDIEYRGTLHHCINYVIRK